MADPSVTLALANLGLKPAQVEPFLAGTATVYLLPTEGNPGIAMIRIAGGRLRSGIIEINDPGSGLKDFLLFRSRSLAVARALGFEELELFAGAVIDPKLESLLLRKGFERSLGAVPDDLGGGTMEILSRVFPVSPEET